MRGPELAQAIRTMIICGMVALTTGTAASARTAGIEEKYGTMTMPDGTPCEVTLITYVGDPEQVQLKGKIQLPNGNIVLAPITSPLGHWRQVMNPKGNMSVMRDACGAMQDQVREKGIIPK